MISLLRSLTRYLYVSWPMQLLTCGCVFGFAGPLHAQSPARFPVMPEQVRLAMQGRNWPVEGVQVRLAAVITATVAKPSLEIDSVAPGAAHNAMLRLACRVHTECLPFFASVVWPADLPVPSLSVRTESTSRSAFGGHVADTGTADSPELQAGSISATNAPAPPAVHAGSPATLLLNGARIHIRLHVVFAQGGHVGDTVRVTTPDRKQVYVAEVLTPELLQGEL